MKESDKAPANLDKITPDFVPETGISWGNEDSNWYTPEQDLASDNPLKQDRPIPAGAFLMGQVPLAGDLSIALDTAKPIRDKHLADTVGLIVTDTTKSMSDKLTEAQSIVNSFKRDTPTIADSFTLNTGKVLSKPLATVIDASATADHRTNTILDYLDQDGSTGVNIIKDPHPVWSSLTATVNKIIAKSGDAYVEGVKEFVKDKPYLQQWFFDTSDQIGGVAEIPGKVFQSAVTGGAPQSALTALTEGLGVAMAPIDEAVAIGLKKGIGLPANASLNDLMKVLQGVEENPEIQSSLMDPIMGYATGQWQNHPEYLDTWHNNQVAKHGPDYAYKAGAELAKMGAIEAGVFYMAKQSPAVAEMLWSQAGKELPKLTRLGKILTRTLYGAGGYTAVDRQLDDTGDIPQDPLAQEFMGNLIGQGLGEGGVVIAGAAIKGAIKSGKGIYGVLAPNNAGVNDLTKSVSSELIKDSGALNLRKSVDDQFISEMKLQDAPELSAPVVKQNLTAGVNSLGEAVDHTFTQAIPNTPIKEAISTAKHVDDIKSDFSAVTGVNDVKEIYFGKDPYSALQLRDEQFNVKPGVFNLRSWFGEGDETVGKPIKDYFDFINEGHGIHEAAFNMMQSAFKGLKNDNIDNLLAVRKNWEDLAATNPDFVGTETDLIKAGLSAKERRAFWGVEQAFKNYHEIANEIGVNAARRRGHKQLELGLGDHNPLVKIDKDFGDGFVQVSEVKHGSDKDPIKSWKVPNSAVLDPTQVVGYKKYFMPQRLDNPKWMIAELDPTTGTTQVTHAFQRKADMMKEYRRLEGLQDSKVRAYGQWGEQMQTSSFGISGQSQAIVDTFDAVTITRMRDNLRSAGLSGAEVDDYIKGLNSVSYGAVINKDLAGHRGKGLRGVDGEPAKYLPSKAAIDAYIGNLSYAMVRDGQDATVNKFFKQYREVLDLTKSWDQELPKVYSKNPQLLSDAKVVQDTLKTVFRTKTTITKHWENIVADFEMKNPKVFATIDKIPVVNKLLLDTRNGLGVIKQNTSRVIFAGNTASFMGQWMSNTTQIAGAQMLKDPNILPLAMMDLSRAVLAKGYEGITGGVNKDAAAMLSAMRRSHWFSEMDINELNFGHPSQIDRFAFATVKGGELMNRGIAFSISRRQLMAEAETGALKGLDGKPFKGKVDDREFLRLVLDKAKVYAGDMTAAGRIRFFQGSPVRELVFQFLAPQWKTFRPYVASQTSFREKVGAGTAMVALWGPTTIPLVGGMLALGDAVVFKASGSNDIDKARTLTNMVEQGGSEFIDWIGENANLSESDTALLQRIRKRGAVEALTDGEVSLVHKMSADAFANDVIKRLSAVDAKSSVPSISVISNVASKSSDIFEFIGALWASNEKNKAYKEAGILPPEDSAIEDNATMGGMIRTLGQMSPGIGLFADYVNNSPEIRSKILPMAAEGTWVKRNWDAVPLDGGRIPTARDFFFNQMGIKPQEVIREQNIRDKDAEYGGYAQIIYDKYKNNYNRHLNNPEALARIDQEALESFSKMEESMMVDHEQVLVKLGGSYQEGGKGAVNTARYQMGSIYTNWRKDVQRDSRQLGYGIQPSLSTGN
ncbi:MAG: hypothetical protein H7836_13290 [Magnetococcus sp. YQC-3]